jgi:hypothetical protein
MLQKWSDGWLFMGTMQEKLNRMTFQQREKYKEKKMALLRVSGFA